MSQAISVFPAHERHSRRFEDNRFVYPVLSRRSRGVSIGVNLNPDKACNFHCIYCQVNRRVASAERFVELDALLGELEDVLSAARDGSLYEDPRFAGVPRELMRVNDIAFSGDGEPTAYRNFGEICEAVAGLVDRHNLPELKLVVITNASLFHRDYVRRALELLDRHQGEIWAKLDAGTKEYFHRVNRTTIRFQRILDNLLRAALERSLVIQSLFMRIDGAGPGAAEVDAFAGRLQDICCRGGKLKLIQLHTVARSPAESSVSALLDEQLDAIAKVVRERLPDVPVEVYYGRQNLPPQ